MGQVRRAHHCAGRARAISRPGAVCGRGAPARSRAHRGAGGVAGDHPAGDVDASGLRRGKSAIAERVVTASPDVTVSTNLGAWVNRRGLFAREKMADTFKSERIPSTFNWDFSPKGQHIELGIAEMNLFILLSALG